MTYRGYAARIDYSEDDSCFVGHIADISDIVGFHGESVAELRAVFEEAVDDYIETCKELDRPSQEPLSDSLLVGVPPDEQAATGIAAEDNSNSVNQLWPDRWMDGWMPKSRCRDCLETHRRGHIESMGDELTRWLPADKLTELRDWSPSI